MGPRVEGLVNQRSDTQLLVIDIKSWNSAVAKQYGIRRLPTLWLYDGTQRSSTDTRDVLTRLQQ